MRELARILCALIAIGSAHCAASHTVEELLRPPVVRDIDLSPDGKRIAIAFVSQSEDGDDIAVVEVERLGQPDAISKRSLRRQYAARIKWLTWATNDRLLISAVLTTPRQAQYSRVYGVSADLRDWTIMFAGTDWVLGHVHDLARVVGVPSANGRVMLTLQGELFNADAYSGEALRIAHGNRHHTIHWSLDESRAGLRYDIDDGWNDVSLYGRASEAGKWTLLTKFWRGAPKPEFDYAADAPGAGNIYVRTRGAGVDTFTIREFDLATRTLGETLAAAPGFDIDTALVIDGQILGARYFADRLVYVLSDEKLQRSIAGLDSRFGAANVEIIDVDRLHARLMVRVRGPQVPEAIYLADANGATPPQLIIASRPWLDAKQLAAVEVRKTRTYDGQVLDSYLTRPAGSGAQPLIVMPHDGPNLRDRFDYDAIAQVFAAQGWLVLQTNFRGSAGYGKAFEEAGYREWGKRMQSDLADAVQELVKAGIADVHRIAIYGRGYGGYAALAAAVSSPQLYRAVVAVNPISDLPDFLEYQRDTGGAKSETYKYWVERIGDPKSDTPMLEAASPRLQARQIRAAVLLMGDLSEDWIPSSQSRAMKSALVKAGKNVRLAEFTSNQPWWSAETETAEAQEAVEFFRCSLAGTTEADQQNCLRRPAGR
ncbi:MAG TPA: prolyl oligopeptidase family serine peptidase [Steroidobacteraceae bacterium]|nr:prolyl oligopeptidase family serine peptidase [Steroidobacteraceae bacterium]